MSLINNMLRDLENRTNNTRLNSHIEFLKPTKIITPYWSLKKIMSIIFLCILCTVFFLSFYISGTQPVARPLLKSVAYPSFSGTDLVLLPVKQILLKNINITNNKPDTTLSFEMSGESLYSINYDRKKDAITLELNDTNLTADIPKPDNQSAIKHISSLDKNSALHLYIGLKSGTEITAIDQSESTGKHTLTISLLNATEKFSLPDTLASAPDKKLTPIKKPSKDSELQEMYLSAVSDAESGKMNIATEKLSVILNKDPEYHDARATLAALLIKKNNNRLALLELNNGLKLNPDYIPFIELKARLLASDDKPNQALILLNTVSPEIKNHADYYTLLAALYERLDKNQLAAQTYQQLLKNNPHNGNWWIGLGVSLEKLGHKNSAADAYRHALTEDNLNGETLAYAKHQLSSIEGLE